MENFTKDMLKTGMIIEYRNGWRRIVLKDTNNGDVFGGLNDTGYGDTKNWTEELKSIYCDNSWDIMKVYQPIHVGHYLSTNNKDIKLIWERKERVKREFKIIKASEEYYISMVTNDVHYYLHNDGVIRELATRGKLKTGWYSSKEEAEFAIEIYNQRFEKGLRTEDE